MQIVSNDYKDLIKTNLALSPKTKIVVDNQEYLGDVIKKFPKITHSNSSFIGGFPAKTVSFDIFDLNNDLNLENKEITIYKGLVVNGSIEWVKQGVFIPKAKDITTNISAKTISLSKVQDRTQLFDDKYESSLDWSINHTGLEIVQEICNKKGITLASNTFNFANYSFKQPNFNETITNREVISRIAEIGGEIAFFDCDGNLVIKSQLATGDTIQRARYEKLSKEKEFKINTVVLGKKGIDDDIVYPEAIETERVEFRIEDNPFVDLYRQEMIEEVANYIIGKSYIPFKLDGFVDGFVYELNDVVSVLDKNGNTFDAVILDYETNNRIKANVKAETQNTTKTNYNLAGSKQEAINQVKLEVDHINQKVEVIATETNELNNTISTTTETITAQGATIEILTEKTQKIDDEGNVTSVKTTNGYTLNSEGLKIYTSEDEFNAQHKATGTYYKDGNSILSQTTKDGTKTKDIELYGIFKYGKETIDDEPMFISQMYEDEDGEKGFGHFYNGGEIQ